MIKLLTILILIYIYIYLVIFILSLINKDKMNPIKAIIAVAINKLA